MMPIASTSGAKVSKKYLNLDSNRLPVPVLTHSEKDCLKSGINKYEEFKFKSHAGTGY